MGLALNSKGGLRLALILLIVGSASKPTGSCQCHLGQSNGSLWSQQIATQNLGTSLVTWHCAASCVWLGHQMPDTNFFLSFSADAQELGASLGCL